jgi:two-component system phosphate regulon sensor histidine kinase PhoR
MTQKTRQLILASAAMILIFALYEVTKSVLFPGISLFTSHLASTIVVGLITLVTARYVIQQQAHLLSERERANERLREALADAEHSGSLLRSIVASVDEGLVITGRDSRVLLVNDAARGLLGLAGRPAGRLADLSRDPQVHQAFAQVLATGDRAQARVEVWLKEGNTQERHILQLHAAPLRLGADQVDGVVGAFIDITKLEKLERIRQEFLANVSHELRTPLSSIIAYVETLLNGGLDDNENCLRFLGTVQRNAERMRALVNDVAELSAIESGAVRLTLSRFSFRDLVAEVFNGLQPRGDRHRVRLHNPVPASCQVTADRRRLEQILTNLVDNAIKFNRPGGTVSVTAALTEDGTHHLIKVRDSGPGIPQEHLARVFERFYRVDQARSREAGGTGLGLAIVKHLARAHGGEAYVTSEVGAGSEFVVKLPNREAGAQENADQQALAAMGQSAAREK